MLESKRFEDQVGDLFDFFVNAEVCNEEVTYEQIQDRLIDRKYDTLVWYANNFWTWFLSKKKERRKRLRVFVCHGLNGYSRDFFIAAHVKHQGKYFYHFGRALDDSRERARIRKEIKAQGESSSSELPDPPTDAEQDFPEELHFADNETEEMEGGESPGITADTSMVALSREPAPFMAPTPATGEPASEIPIIDRSVKAVSPIGGTSTDGVLIRLPVMTIRERILELLGFSRKDREALDQFLTTFGRNMQDMETQMQALRQKQDQIPGELETLRLALIQQIQQNCCSPDDLAQLSLQVQALVREQEQFGVRVTNRMEALAEEIRQSRLPFPDFSPIHADLANQMSRVEQNLTGAIRLLPTSSDLTSMGAELEKSSEHQQKILSEFSQVVTEITNLEQQVGTLASQFSSASTNGQTTLLQSSLNEASAEAKGAIDKLGKKYMEWLAVLQDQLQEIQQGHDETKKSLERIRVYVSPDGEKRQDGDVVPD